MYRIIIILILASFGASAQPVQYLGTPLRVTDNRGYFMSDSGNRAFTPLDTISATYVGSGDRMGDARLKSNIPYVRTSTQWVRLATGQLDSTIYATKYDVDTMRTSLYTKIATKVDSVTKSNDTLYYWKVGVRTYIGKYMTSDTNALVTNTPLSLILDTVQRNGLNSALWISTIGALINTNALGVTQHDSTGLQLVNNTAAAAGAQQISPGIRLRGYGYKTNAAAGSFATDWNIYNLPVEGAAAPTTNLLFRAKVGAGAYATKITAKSDALAIVFDTFGETINGTGIIRADASNMGIYYSNQSNGYLNGTSAGWLFNYGSTAKSATSGTEGLATITYTISPASGSYTHRGLLINGTINQNPAATGLTYGVLVQPTLTNAIDWKSISWDNTTHWGLYGSGTAKNYLNGNLLLKTTTDDASSLLTMVSTTQGFLPPRWTNAQMAAVSSPGTGLLGYNTDAKMLVTYDGSAYKSSGIVSGSYNSGAVIAQTTFTVTFGGTQPNSTYHVAIDPTVQLAAAPFYVTNKTTTTFDVVYLSGLTGAVKFDFIIVQ